MLFDKVYTGIGSRKTPIEVQETMIKISKSLALQGYILRSGGAVGADSAFETGCDYMDGDKEIYIPWKNFGDRVNSVYFSSDKAFRIAETIHPKWNILSDAAKRLHARNVHQILGKDLKTLTNFVICWTEDGKVKGGTATAIKLAKSYKIPVYNLYDFKDIGIFL